MKESIEYLTQKKIYIGHATELRLTKCFKFLVDL